MAARPRWLAPRAAKIQVAQMMRALLNLDEPPPSDAADALALAVTHLRRAPLDEAIARRVAQDPRLATLATPRRAGGRARLRVVSRGGR